MDATRAAQGHFGGRIAHGPLLIAIALGLGSIDVPQANTVAMVGTNWRFLKPVKPGMTVHATWRLGRTRDVTNPRWGLGVWQVELLDQAQDRVLEGEVTLLVARREAAAPAAARSRRRRRSKATVPALTAITAEANLPEPAPADTPAPARRRRRSSTSSARPEPGPAVGEAPVEAAIEAPSTEAVGPSTSRRRRRRRGGGGGSGGAAASSSGSAGGNPNADQSPPPPFEARSEPTPVPAPDPPRSQWAAPEAVQPAGNPVSRALGRLRRLRPADPAPEETRSPAE
jgi:hypothetical protein